MVTDEVDLAAKDVLKILCGFDVIKELRRHGYKNIYIAALMMIASGY